MVAIPLICELLFVAYLLNLQDRAFQAAKVEARAHHLSDSLHDVVANVLAIIMELRGYALYHLQDPESTYKPSFRNMYASLDHLKEQVQDDAKAQEVIAESEQGTRDAEATLDQVRAAEVAQSPDLLPLLKDSRHKLDKALKTIVTPRLIQLVKDSDKSSDLAEQDRTQELMRSLTLALVLVSTGLSVTAAVYFGKEIAGRINEVGRNASRLSIGQPLGPPIAGADEIAHLDKDFREMAALLESAMLKQRAVFENARDMICSLDRGLVVTAVNPACSILLGQSVEEILGARIVSLIAENERASFAENLNKLLSAGHVDQISTQMVDKTGCFIDVFCSAHWSATEQQFFCVFHDVSALKAAERLRQDVVAMVTHDIRSPLNAVITFEEMLGTGSLGELTERGQRLLNLSKRSTSTINLLVNDLLDIEKIEQGQLSLNFEQFPIADCIDRSLQSLAVWADQQQVELRKDQCDTVVTADEHRIGQVITNLVSNAIKFSDKDKVVTVTAHADDGWLAVGVTDQGSGIPPEEINLIFERFRQGRSKKAHLGSGLGLSICKALIELHCGTIKAESEVGKGSTFSFRIPINAERSVAIEATVDG